MPTITIAEGQVATVNPADTLKYPSINSCLSITTVLPQTTRLGGHAVLVPEGDQLELQGICDSIQTRAYADQLYVIGDIGTWNENWDQLPQCQTLRIDGHAVANVADMAARLGYPTAVLFDINAWGGGTFDVYFGFENDARSLWGEDTRTHQRVGVPDHPSW
ncbi:MAG: hypothetical protein AAGC60_09410 [Acidobacteriota bacterium]